MTDEQIMEIAKEAGFHYPHNDCLLIPFAKLIEQKSQREWVGLTHEERDEIDQNCRSQMEALFAVEAKLKEKNT